MLKKVLYSLIIVLNINLILSSENRLTKSGLKNNINSAINLPNKIQNLIANYYGSYWSFKNLQNMALVIVPVADVTTKTIAGLDNKMTVDQMYNNFSISPETGPNSCLRVHQLLFNEVVTILQETVDEVEFTTNTVFFENEKKECVNKFWTHKKNIKRLIDFPENLEAIPSFYGSFQKIKIYLNNNIISLKKPWLDINTKIIYSAGTRFVLYDNQTNKASYEAKILNIDNNQIDKIIIDKSFASISKKISSDQKILNFVDLLHDWSNTDSSKAIPYVWGGCSFISTYEPQDFKLFVNQENTKLSYWIRPIERHPYTGMDCSGLILRAAQICNLPYFYKNTTTLANRLRSLNPSEEIQNGDFIFFPGHVMIVSNIKSNQFIHASGYASQHGCLKICHLNEIFENINSYQDLRHAYVNNIPFGLRNARGQKIKELTTYKILRIVN